MEFSSKPLNILIQKWTYWQLSFFRSLKSLNDKIHKDQILLKCSFKNSFSHRKRRKRTFILLEILIALFLISLSALPLIRLPRRAAKEAFHIAWRLELKRLADLSFAEFKAQLYQQTVPLETIVQATQKRTPLEKGNVSLPISFSGTRSLFKMTTLSATKKTSKEGITYYLLTYTVRLKRQENKPFVALKRRKRTALFTYKVIVSSPPHLMLNPSNN